MAHGSHRHDLGDAAVGSGWGVEQNVETADLDDGGPYNGLDLVDVGVAVSAYERRVA